MLPVAAQVGRVAGFEPLWLTSVVSVTKLELLGLSEAPCESLHKGVGGLSPSRMLHRAGQFQRDPNGAGRGMTPRIGLASP